MTDAASVRKAFGYLFENEFEALRDIVREDLPQYPVIVNIGAGAGTSGLLFLETRLDTTVYTIDITDESSPFGCLEGERVAVKQAGLGHLAGTRWHQIHGDSKDVARTWPENKPVDLLFIDGDHSYDGCWGDLTLWYQHMNPGSIVAVHDYYKEQDYAQKNTIVSITDEIRATVIKPYPGVDRAVDDFLRGLNDPVVWVVETTLFFQVPYIK